MKQINQENINFELLVDYVEGLLDEAAQARIQARIAEDEYYAEVVNGIQFYFQEHGADRAKLEAYLADFQQRLEAKVNQATPVRRLWSTSVLSIAASVAVIALIGWMAINLLSNTSNPDHLVAAALEVPYPNVYTPTKGFNGDSIRAKIGDLYSQGAYAEITKVMPIFLEKTEEQRVEDYFLLGISYLYQKTPDAAAAVEVLKQAKSSNPPATLVQQIDWYLALAYYNEKDLASAKRLLNAIAQQADHYREMQAMELLQGMD